MIKAEVKYETGIKEFWIAGDSFDKLASELIKFDYGVYKTRKEAKYYYMGQIILMHSVFSFEENKLWVLDQLENIEKMTEKLL